MRYAVNGLSGRTRWVSVIAAACLGLNCFIVAGCEDKPKDEEPVSSRVEQRKSGILWQDGFEQYPDQSALFPNDGEELNRWHALTTADGFSYELSSEFAHTGEKSFILKADGVKYRAGKIPFAFNGRAMGMAAPEGFAKILADAETDRILGVHIVGANASELIAEAVVAMEFAGAAEDLARICHAHPTMSEVVHEAALAVDKRPLHF